MAKLSVSIWPYTPIDPPDTLYSLFADSPWWSGREMLADLLLTLPHWGYTRVRWVTADAHTPPQIARDKTVLYFQGPDLPTVVAQIFWEPQLPYPPFGVSSNPQPHPGPVIPKRTSRRVSPAAAEQLGFFAPEPMPPARIVTRNIDALAETAIARMKEAYDCFDFLVCGLSGKDSLTTLSLACEMLDRIPESERTKKLIVMSADTRVENPALIGVIRHLHQEIQATAQARNWPVQTVMVQPKGEDTFWSQVVGKGYPPPNRLSRYCTRLTKIGPNEKFLSDMANAHTPEKKVP